MGIEKLIGKKGYLEITDPVKQLTNKVATLSSNKLLNDPTLANISMSMESVSGTEAQLLENVFSNVESSLSAIAQDLGVALESYQIESASIASIISSNPKNYLTYERKNISMEGAGVAYTIAGGIINNPLSSIAMEAYDEKDNKAMQTFNIVYNMLAPVQDEFGDAFFPTIVISPNEVGINIPVTIYYVYNDFKRNVTGAYQDNYRRKNVIRAYADSEVLFNDVTRVVPVFRKTGGADDNTSKFVPDTKVAPWSEKVYNNIEVTTSALAVGVKMDIMGLSQTNELIASGLADASDVLDTYVKLSKIFVEFTDGTETDVVAFDVESLPESNFTYAPQGLATKKILNFDTESLVVTPNTTRVDGTALKVLTEVGTNNWKVLLRTSLSGNVILDKSEIVVNQGTIEPVIARDATDNVVPATNTSYMSLASKVASGRVIGYTVTAYRSNANLAQRGQLFDEQTMNYIFEVKHLAPISVIAPTSNNTVDDGTTVKKLVAATSIRTSNAAVTALLKAEQAMSSYTRVANIEGEYPDVDGIGRFYVRPVFFKESINLGQTVDSLKSSDRIQDIAAAIIERIRFYATEMYRKSEYKAAANVLTGNIGFKPTVIVGTDPVIKRYIEVSGDLRTLGDQFEVKVVETLDNRVSGKIYISFGVFDNSRNTSVNPLNFGNMLWSPEIVSVLPISRNGRTNKEVIVSPRFAHMVNLPVLTVLEVTGLPAAIGKVPVYTHDV